MNRRGFLGMLAAVTGASMLAGKDRPVTLSASPVESVEAVYAGGERVHSTVIWTSGANLGAVCGAYIDQRYLVPAIIEGGA